MRAQMTVVRFCTLTGIPRPTWYRWRAASSSTKGPWPRAAQDTVEVDAKAKADEWDAWGHRKIAELLRLDDGHVVSDATVYRVLARNNRTLPAGYTGEVRQLARIRKEGFIIPPTRRNRLWQADFSEFETEAAGTWNLGGVVDYWARVNLACTVTVTKTTTDAIALLEAALAEVEVLLGVTWIQDLTDPATGEIGTLRIVTDNGPCFRSAGFARWVRSQRHLTHIRTPKKAPWTNGRIERYFRSIKYERLYRHEIGDGIALAAHCADYRRIYNTIRPHQEIGMRRPLELYRQTPTTQPPTQESVSDT
ncbi:MAG: integrase core domain-containing protein [Actinomycetota bacterium]